MEKNWKKLQAFWMKLLNAAWMHRKDAQIQGSAHGFKKVGNDAGGPLSHSIKIEHFYKII